MAIPFSRKRIAALVGVPLVAIVAGFGWWGLEGRTGADIVEPAPAAATAATGVDAAAVPFTTCDEGCTHQ